MNALEKYKLHIRSAAFFMDKANESYEQGNRALKNEDVDAVMQCARNLDHLSRRIQSEMDAAEKLLPEVQLRVMLGLDVLSPPDFTIPKFRGLGE